MSLTPEEIKALNSRNVIATQPDKSSGFGDTVAKVAHAVGADKLAEFYTRVTGRSCGCGERREKLNKLFPYNKGEY